MSPRKVRLQGTDREHVYRTPDGRFTVSAAVMAPGNPHRPVQWRVRDLLSRPWVDLTFQRTDVVDVERLADARVEIARVLDREAG